MVYLVIFFIIAGIIAGYLTNLYAVRWLFCPIKKKGKLPAWDISIAATEEKKNRLIESLANCVTNRILTSDVLREGIPDSVIEKHLRKLVDEILEQEHLKKVNSILQSPELEKIRQKGEVYIERLITNELTPFCLELLKETDFSQLLTEKQAYVIAQNVYEILKTQNRENYNQILKDFCERNSDLTVEQLIGTDLWNVLEEALFSVWLKEKLIEVLKDGKKLEACLNKILDAAEAKERLDELQTSIGKKKFGDVIQLYGIDQFVSYFWKELGEYWKTAEGRRVLEYRKKEWLEFLLSMDVPLETMLNEETWNSIKRWLQANVPELIPSLAEFIQRNEEELDEVIKRSIHIAAEKQKKSEYGSWMKETIQVFLVSQMNLPKRLQRILESVKEKDSDAVVEQILDFLRKQTISNIAKSISKNYPDLWKAVWRESQWKKDTKNVIYQYIKDKPVSWIWDRFSLSLSELVCEKGKKKLLHYVQENPEKTAQWLIDRIRPATKQLGSFAVGKMEEETIEKTSNFLFYKANYWMKKEKEVIVSKVEQWILNQGKEWLRIYPKEHANELTDGIKHWLLQRWHRLELEKLQVSAILNRPKVKEMLVKRGVKQLRTEMDQALQNQIYRLVVDALNRLEPDQLCREVEKLMGGQLKYLSYFGGFLGFLISAAICYWAVPGLSVYGNPTSWSGLIFGTVAMGVIGVITNIVAIKMLFYPKKQIKWLAKSKHFHLLSEGVILQNQETFAAAMANYVSSELISEQAVRQLYEAKKAELPDQLRQWVDQEGMEWLRQNREKLAQRAVDELILHREDMVHLIREWLEKQTMNQIITPEMIQSIIKASDIQTYAKQQVIKCINGEKQLSDYFSNEQIQRTFTGLIEKGETRVLSYIKDVSLEEIAARNEMKYQTYISKKWSLEQKKAAHLWLKKKWNQADTARMKEKSLVWIIKKCDDLSQEEKLIREILVFGQPIEQWGEKLLDKKIEQIIDWFYIHVIKKKIEQTFGYQESERAKSDDWWENIQETVTSFGTKKMMEPIFRDAIWELKEVQLPLYLKSKKQEFHTILQVFLREKLYSITAGQAILLVLGEDYPATLNRILFGTIWREPSQMSMVLERSAHMALSLILDQSPKVYLHMLKMDSLIDVEKNFHKNLEIWRWNFLRVEKEKRSLVNILADWFGNIVGKTYVYEMGTLLHGATVECMAETVLSQENINAVIHIMIKPILEEYRFAQLVSMEDLADSVKAATEVYFQTTVWMDQVKIALAEQIGNLTKYEKLPETIKNQISCYVVEMIGDALQKQLGEIMEDLDLYGITEQRLNALTADEMETTIRAFADPIFKTLYVLGVLGAVAGVNCYIAIVIYFIEKLKTKKDK